MYTSVSIQNFRCFEDLTVKPLARVNLIAGGNNVGKTALLEALWLLSHPAEPREALRIAFWRNSANYGRGEFFADLFHRYATDSPIKLQAGTGWDNGVRTLNIHRKYREQQAIFDWSNTSESEDYEADDFDFSSEVAFEYIDETGDCANTVAYLYPQMTDGRLRPELRGNRASTPAPKYPCVFVYSENRPNARALAARFGKAELEGYSDTVVKMLRLLEPRLKRMTTITNNRGIPIIHGDIGVGRLLPITIMGDGTRRLLNLMLSFINARNGVMFIDETENGLHHSVLEETWKNLDRLSREFNVQVFATTHSYECIVAANNAFSELESNEMHLHRLYRRDDRVKAVTYTKEALDTNIEYFWEVR